MVALLVILAFLFLILWLIFSHTPAPPWLREVCMFAWAFLVTLLAAHIGLEVSSD